MSHDHRYKERPHFFISMVISNDSLPNKKPNDPHLNHDPQIGNHLYRGLP